MCVCVLSVCGNGLEIKQTYQRLDWCILGVVPGSANSEELADIVTRLNVSCVPLLLTATP